MKAKSREYLNVAEAARKLNVSERSVRNYCAQGRVGGAYLDGKTWMIPSDVQLPERKKRVASGRVGVREALLREMESGIHGGLYHWLQINFTYNSNHMEGSRLTEEETRYIFETRTVGTIKPEIPIDDIVETANHFRCIDLVIRSAKANLNEAYVKRLHFQLKNGTTDSRKGWFAVGEYKRRMNSVGDLDTAAPEDVRTEMRKLLSWYKSERATFERIVEFHLRFERIHPFQDGNGRVGRLLMFKECLRHGITPFVIDESLRFYYYRGLKEWDAAQGYLLDTCRTGQDRFESVLAHFAEK